MFNRIDKTRLSIDYAAQTIDKRRNKITEDDLRYLYLELNLSILQVSMYTKIAHHVIAYLVKKYNFKKDIESIKQARKETSKLKYGVEYASQAKWFKDRVKKTVKEKYGVENISMSAEVKAKKEQTCTKNYGVSNPSQAEEVKIKKEITAKNNYGFTNPMKSPLFREKYLEGIKQKNDGVMFQQKHIKNKEIWFDDIKLTTFIKEGTETKKKYTTKDLMGLFNISEPTAAKRVRELGLWEYITLECSVTENMIFEQLKSMGAPVVKYRKDGLEIDIFNKDVNAGIEFNGNYWHSTDVKPDINYHLNKTTIANERGIFIYHLYEYEWLDRKEQVLNQIKNLFNINTLKIFARNCEVKAVCTKDATAFQNKNHLRGSTGSSVKLGLYYNNELVSLMTFGKPRFNRDAEWELVRFCSKAGTNVVGGASKLFKHFVKMFKPKSIVSYSEIAKTKGKVYTALGFVTIRTTKPNYVWVSTNKKTYTRYQAQKHLLVKQGLGTADETEDIIMHRNNYHKLYDCGNRVHLWRSEK